MRKEEIFEILSDTNFWFKEIETGIKREDYLSLINQTVTLTTLNHRFSFSIPHRCT
mgnify:CR=1 FL=1